MKIKSGHLPYRSPLNGASKHNELLLELTIISVELRSQLLNCSVVEQITLVFRDCTVRVWRLSPGNPCLVKELSGHSELVHYVAIDQVHFVSSNS